MLHGSLAEACLVVRRVKPDGLVEASLGSFVIPQHVKGHSLPEVCLGVVGVEQDCLAEGGNCGFVLSQAAKRDALV